MKIEDEIQQRSFKSTKQKAAINIMYTYFWVKEKLFNALKPYGITLQQYNVLRILNGQFPNGITTSDIRDRMLDKMSDASRLVDRLEVHGLAAKRINIDDRRLVSIRITDKGREMLDKITADHGSLDGFMSNLTFAEFEELNALLDKLRG
jgi:DNA-binding MarR family transcriptional regulator